MEELDYSMRRGRGLRHHRQPVMNEFLHADRMPAGAPAGPATRRSGRPSWKDPRWVFAGLLMVYAALGCSVLGFNRSPWQMALTVAGCAGLDMLLARWLRKERLFPLSAVITGLGLSLLLNYPHDHFLMFLPVFWAIGSKYLFTCGGRHAFNPGLFGVVAALMLGGGRFATSPPYQWGEHSWLAAAMIGAAAVAGFVLKIRRGPLLVSFLVSFAVLTAVRAWVMRWHLPPATLIEGTLASPAFFLFTFYMITDPQTSPTKPWHQVMWGIAVAALDLVFHFRTSLATLFLALFWVSAARWIGWHALNLWHCGPQALVPAPSWLARVSVIALIGLSGSLVYSKVLHPAVVAKDPGFVFEPVSAGETGITSQPDALLTRVDPRIAHVAKWVLSVGDAVAVGDVDGDGRPDLFLTQPLKRPEDRNALYRNLGGMKFERLPLPALDDISRSPETHGVVAGAVFADYDNSGRASLLLTTGWGRVRLLRNEPGGDGQPHFRDVTASAGIDEYTVSVAATFADFDLDGDLDLFIGNAMQTELPGYDPPERFNIFKLPAEAHPGDRRPYHFMHETWHNARNGGRNVFYRNTGDGRFRREDSAALGLPETHWTMAVGAADLNQDGWPDLYCASDYGPDDLYLNEGGRSFRRIEGRFVGSIGRDTYKGMNVSVGDLDNRGWDDVLVSNVHAPLQAEGSLVWRIQPDAREPGGIRIEDRASQRRLVNEQRFGWGAAMGDLNLDGWLDVVQANGMVDDSPDRRFPVPQDYWYRASLVMRAGPEVHSYADRWADLRGYEIWGRQRNRVYLSNGRPPVQFADVASSVGLTAATNTRAAALADLDLDGDLDLVLTHQFAAPEIFRNSLLSTSAPGRPGAAHWVNIDLAGDGARVSRDAVGARVTVTQGGLRQSREVSLTSGFSAQGERRLHFGLGGDARPIDVEVRWPGGPRQTFSGLPVDRRHRIHVAEPMAAVARE